MEFVAAKHYCVATGKRVAAECPIGLQRLKDAAVKRASPRQHDVDCYQRSMVQMPRLGKRATDTNRVQLDAAEVGGRNLRLGEDARL